MTEPLARSSCSGAEIIFAADMQSDRLPADAGLAEEAASAVTVGAHPAVIAEMRNIRNKRHNGGLVGAAVTIKGDHPLVCDGCYGCDVRGGRQGHVAGPHIEEVAAGIALDGGGALPQGLRLDPILAQALGEATFVEGLSLEIGPWAFRDSVQGLKQAF